MRAPSQACRAPVRQLHGRPHLFQITRFSSETAEHEHVAGFSCHKCVAPVGKTQPVCGSCDWIQPMDKGIGHYEILGM